MPARREFKGYTPIENKVNDLGLHGNQEEDKDARKESAKMTSRQSLLTSDLTKNKLVGHFKQQKQ